MDIDGARGKQEVQRSATMIRAFHATCPHVQLWFSHDEDHLQMSCFSTGENKPGSSGGGSQSYE
jgi:hypothetical protein